MRLHHKRLLWACSDHSFIGNFSVFKMFSIYPCFYVGLVVLVSLSLLKLLSQSLNCHPERIYYFQVNNGNTGKMFEVRSKLTIKTPERHWLPSGVFFENFKPALLVALVSQRLAERPRLRTRYMKNRLMVIVRPAGSLQVFKRLIIRMPKAL